MISMYKRLVIAVVFLATVCASVATASTPQPPDAPRDYVVDLAGIIRSDLKDELNATLRTLEQKTTAQVLVLTVQTLDNQSIEEFALNTKEKWKLGQKGKDNGVLIVVALKDRKYRIEVGYGLESVLPDSMVGSIGREYFVPYFRQGDFSTGIYAGTIAVIRTISTHEGVSITNGTGGARTQAAYPGKRLNMFQMIVLGIFGIIALVLFITHPGQCFLIILASQMGGSRGGWSGGGGGGFGGGGSFGGGGGGSGGGGGASGGW
jgi:uncharacterized protein